MSTIIEATFDGEVFRPIRPIDLPPNTKVQITVEETPATKQPYAFLKAAAGLTVDGPADWSENVDRYLYGEETQGDRQQ